MNRRQAILCLSTAVCAAGQTEKQWKAGVAKAKITPTESIWLAGYAARTKPSEGVQTELYLNS